MRRDRQAGAHAHEPGVEPHRGDLRSAEIDPLQTLERRRTGRSLNRNALRRPRHVDRHRAGRGPGIAELAVGIVAPTVHCEGCCWAERHAAAYDSAGVVTTGADCDKAKAARNRSWRGTVRRCAVAKLPQVVIPPAVGATYPRPRATCVVGSRAYSKSEGIWPADCHQR